MNVPPYRKPKAEDVGIKIEDVTHQRDTRRARQAETNREEADTARRKEQQVMNEKKDRDNRLCLELELPSLLNSLNPEGFVVRAFREDDLGKRDDYITLDRDCMVILKNKQKELNDTLVLATVSYNCSPL